MMTDLTPLLQYECEVRCFDGVERHKSPTGLALWCPKFTKRRFSMPTDKRELTIFVGQTRSYHPDFIVCNGPDHVLFVPKFITPAQQEAELYHESDVGVADAIHETMLRYERHDTNQQPWSMMTLTKAGVKTL